LPFQWCLSSFSERAPLPARPLVFVSESDPLLLSLCSSWLVEGGFAVVTSLPPPSGRRPHLALVDVATPKGARSQVRRLQIPADMPVLLMSARLGRTASSSPGIAEQLGVRGVLSKPFSREQLLAAVQEALRSGA